MPSEVDLNEMIQGLAVKSQVLLCGTTELPVRLYRKPEWTDRSECNRIEPQFRVCIYDLAWKRQAVSGDRCQRSNAFMTAYGASLGYSFDGTFKRIRVGLGRFAL